MVNQFLDFAANAPTAFHAAALWREQLLAAGFEELDEARPWHIAPGSSCFVMRNGSAIIALRVPRSGFAPFLIGSAHGDSPAFRLKEHFEDASGPYVRVSTEIYGGMIMSSWMDRPLSVAGRLAVREGGRAVPRLVKLDRDVVLIPNVPIHFNRKVNDGYTWQPQTDLVPLYGEKGTSASLMKELAAAAGVRPEDILSHDLFLCSRERGRVWGADDAFFSCPRIDDLECAWSLVNAFVAAEPAEKIGVCAVFDNEEVGSRSLQGADSDFLFNTLVRAGLCLGAGMQEIMAAMAAGFMVSADNAHALHPNHPELYDSLNRTYMNRGIVIKHNASLKYSTDSLCSARFSLVCERAGVPVQHFANRSDLPGGSTLSNKSISHVSLPSVDIGLAQLAMHSLVETAGTRDLPYLADAMKAFWTSPD